MMTSMKDNKDVACYFVTKLSWKGKYHRIFSVGTLGITTYNLHTMEITNQWPYSEFINIYPNTKSQLNTEFHIVMKKGKKTDTMRFSSDYRADIVTEALKYKHLFAESKQENLRYNATKHHWSDQEIPVVLEVSQRSLNQIDPSTGEVLACYCYRDIGGLSSVTDCTGGLVVITDSFDRVHFFKTDKREEIMKKIVEAASLYIGVNLKFRDTLTTDQAISRRFGKFSTDEAITSLCDFVVHKISPRHKEPIKRILGLTECCLVERDSATYSLTTLKPLSEVSALIRSQDNPQLFCIEYVKSQIRCYTSSDRDALLASLLDGVRASGNRDIHVKMLSTDTGKRIGPFFVPVDEEVERFHLKFLLGPPSGWDFAETVNRFNSNVPYSGLLHTVTADGLFSDNKEKFYHNALVSVLDKEGDQDKISNEDLEAQFHAIRRLVACKFGFAAFTQVPKVRERIGLKVVRALKRNNDGVAHAAIDMVCALMQPMHDDYDLYQEQQNKLSLLSTRPFLESLMDMFVSHVERGTGALVVSAMLDFLTFALCAPYSETTDGGQFDSLLELVASHGRKLFLLFQHPSIAVVKGAGLVMKAIIEEGDSEIATRMQDLALAEAALPRHLLSAIYTQGSDSRLFALRQLSRHLVGLWITGHQTTLNTLKRIIPAGLLAYLESKETPPKEAVESLKIRDNLKLAQDHSNKNFSRSSQWRIVEKHVENLLQHWKTRINLHKNDEKNQPKPVVLRKRRERIKSEANWLMFYYQFNQDHARPDLIWNYRTREELKDALENEVRAFSQDRDLCSGVVVAWNHTEFEVSYLSLAEEIKVGDYYLRLLLEEDDKDESNNSHIKRSSEFFNDLYHRFLLTSKVEMKSMCLRAMAIVYGRHHEDIGPFNDTKYIVNMLEKSTDRTERDRLLYFIGKLIHNKKNVKDLIDANGVKILVDFITLAHLHTTRAVVPTQTNVIEASPDMMIDSEKEWYYKNVEAERQGPYSFPEMKELWSEGKLNMKSRCWAQGMDGWKPLHAISQLKWCLSASGAPLMNETDLAIHILNMLIKICEYYPSRDLSGAVVRPIPRVKRKLSDNSYLPHIVQLLLTFDPILVEKVAVLLTHVMQHNPSITRLYFTGFFYFILMYTGSNILPIGNLLHMTHSCQSFRLDEGVTITQRSILGQILPEAMVCYLENHGAAKFAEIFLGEFDTPEAIWNAEMRRFMIEKIASHIADFTPRMRSNTRSTYQYCPMPTVLYPQLQNELFCNIYYLRHLCDTIRFPDWPVNDPVQLLKDVLETWKQELDKKPPSFSVEEACEVLGLQIDERFDDTRVRRAYFRLAQKYHPDKNPDGREVFEKVNKAYEYLCNKSQRKTDGPDPINLTLILKTQAILFSRYREELHPYKYAGYPLLIKMIQTETDDEQLLSKPNPLLGVATETTYHTLNCSELNVEELRREGGLEILQKAFSRCVETLNQSSKPNDLCTLVCKYCASCFAVAAKFPACREVIAEKTEIIRDLCHVLYFKHLTELCAAVVECVSALAVEETLQVLLYNSGVVFHLLLFFFNYDFTLEEGGVERAKESNQQAIANHLAQLSVLACARLAGVLDGDDSTPPNHSVRQSLRSLLTPYMARKLALLSSSENLKILNSNTENPYLIWDNSTRAELMEYLRNQQRSKVRTGECDPSYGATFSYSLYEKELVVGEIFVRVYNEQPTFPLENPRQFALDLLDFIGSQAQFLHSAKSLINDAGGDGDYKHTQRFKEAEQALEALHNVIRNHQGVEALCIGHFKLIFSLLSLDGCVHLQKLAVEVIQAVTGNKDCVNDIALSDVLVYLLLVLLTFTSHADQLIVLETLLPLMANSKLVREAINKGAIIYLLDLFCNSSNPTVRERTSELLAKMSADKLIGPKLSLTLARFLPQVFLDAMKESPQEAVHIFEGNQENPELIWNDESRERLCSTVRTMAAEQHAMQKNNPSATWKLPQDFTLNDQTEDDLVVAGVYVRLFVQNPSWVLRRPRDFLTECLDKVCALMTKPSIEENIMELLTLAVISLLQSHPNFRDQLPVLGHLPKIVQGLSSSSSSKYSLKILYEVAQSQSCVQSLCHIQCMSPLHEALKVCPEMLDTGCKTLNCMFEKDCPELIAQAVNSGLVNYLLKLLDESTPAATKAHIVQALKSMNSNTTHGDQVSQILDKSKTWADYKDQKHDLFVTTTSSAGYLPSTTNIAGYLTQGSAKVLPRSPPPLKES